MWNRNDYFLGNANARTAEELAAFVYDRACRCDFSVPGFALLNFGVNCDSRSLRGTMVSLERHLNHRHTKEHGKKLVYTSMGRYDQQVTTKPHRDGGPDDSLLMLGYEPTPIESRASLSDYTKCAFDMGIAPKVFLERFNPMYVDGQKALAPYTTGLDAFDNTAFQILLLNNSNSPYRTDETNWLGVLHTAEILNPMPDQFRVVNSTMIASVDRSTGDVVTEAEQREFMVTELVRGAVYR